MRTRQNRAIWPILVAAAVMIGPGCGGYGDETASSRPSGTPPLILIKEVNAWLAAYQKQFGTVPKTYEELTSLYEQSGKTFPPFPDGGSWVYFPKYARVIEVREAWVQGYLKRRSGDLEESRFVHGGGSADTAIRTKIGVSAHPPGYITIFVISGRTQFYDFERTAVDGLPKRGNHTADADWEIDQSGELVAVVNKPAGAGG